MEEKRKTEMLDKLYSILGEYGVNISIEWDTEDSGFASAYLAINEASTKEEIESFEYGCICPKQNK